MREFFKLHFKIPLNPSFIKGELFLLPLAKGGWEGFYEAFSKS